MDAILSSLYVFNRARRSAYNQEFQYIARSDLVTKS